MSSIQDLLDRHQACERGITELRRSQVALEERIDAQRLEDRPTYPTEAQRAGLLVALERVKAGEEPSSHHGDPCCPDVTVDYDGGKYSASYDVVVDGARGWLSVNHRAPYSKRRMGSRLWDFTDEELEAIFAIVREGGHEVLSHWRHDHGVSITVTPNQEA